MKQENIEVISDRFLEKAYGKSKEEILLLYQNDTQFKADYDAIQQHVIDVLSPIAQEVYESVKTVIEAITQEIKSLVEANPDFFKSLQNSSTQRTFQSATL